MKKLLFISAICMLSLNLSAERELPSQSSITLKSIEELQTSDWEYIGVIVAVARGEAKLNAKLYYRVIGKREFFQVRYVYDVLSQTERTSSVTLGNFVFRDKRYNAKFEREAPGWSTTETYYFNL